jgi:hypothetical protein
MYYGDAGRNGVGQTALGGAKRDACFGGGPGKKEILRRCAPLDDGQKRFERLDVTARRRGALGVASGNSLGLLNFSF